MSADDSPVLRQRLHNGLEVRLAEIHTAPVASCWIWYRVGSRNETPGMTGISHWVEHMQFKGTPAFPAGKLDHSMSVHGGSWNAMTWLDFTTYLATMPVDHIDLVLRLEADRMVNSTFDPDEVERERTVVISERQGRENQPAFRIEEKVQREAFRAHSYGNMVIGNLADLKSISRDDLYAFYQRHYSPDNAVLAMAGDFDSQAMLRRIEELYGGIPAQQVRFKAPPEEPTQNEERHVEVQGPGETIYLRVAYHVPAGSAPDFLPLIVLDSLLSGASSLSFLGSSLSNKTTRLYRALVEPGLAAGIGGGLWSTIDPFLYWFHLTLPPGQNPERVLEAFDAELAKILDEPVSRPEIEKAIKQARALFVYDSETITRQAFWLGFAEMIADHTFRETFLERIGGVQPQEILDAARKYLIPSNRVVGTYLPTGKAVDG
jgi:zinc protease